MNTIEMRNTVANAGVFGAIGYGVTEALKAGASALSASKIAYFAPDAAAAGKVLAMNPLHWGGLAAAFMVIDAIARKVLNHINGRENNPPVLELARVTGTVALTGYLATVVGLATSAVAASGYILVSMGVYTLVQRLIAGFNHGAYSIPNLAPTAVKA